METLPPGLNTFPTLETVNMSDEAGRTEPELIFPVGFREGQKISTPFGEVTIGKHRRTAVTAQQESFLRSTHNASFFDESANGQITAAEIAIDHAEQEALAQKPVPDPTKDPEGYELWATAQEAAKKYARAMEAWTRHAGNHQRLVDHATATADEEGTVQLGDSSTGVTVGAESAALRARKRGRKLTGKA